MPQPPGHPAHPGPPVDPGRRPDDVIVGRYRARRVGTAAPPHPEPHHDRGLTIDDNLSILRGERHQMNDDAGLPIDQRTGLLIIGDA